MIPSQFHAQNQGSCYHPIALLFCDWIASECHL